MRALMPVIVALALAAAPASASDLYPVDGGAVFNALPGEVNQVRFTSSGGSGTFVDRRNPIATDEPCRSLASNRARCRLDGPNAVGVSLGDGGDNFRVVRGSRLPPASIIEGGRGADALRAGLGPEKISGGPGADLIIGGRGRDRIDCGRGRDRVVAEPKDTIRRCEIVSRP